MAALTSFADFTRRSRDAQLNAGVVFIETPIGPIGNSDVAMLTWLSWRRCRMEPPGAKAMPLSTKTLCELVSSLRAGLHELGVPDLPQWAKVLFPNPRLECSWFHLA